MSGANPKKRTKPDCLNGYGDGPTHCTLPVGHAGPCNHLTKPEPKP